MRTLIRGGRVAVQDRLEPFDVLLEDGHIAALGPALEASADRVLDATAAYVLPGFIDLHTHLDDRIGRFALADDYWHGSAAAVLNGITTLCSFVTQGPDASLATAIHRARTKAEGHSHADVAWHVTPTTFTDADLGFLEALPGSGYRTCKLYTTYREAGIFADLARIEQLFRRLAPLGMGFLVHCEADDRMPSADPAALDLGSGLSHARLRGAEAEAVAIQRIAALAEATGARVHIVHVSSPGGAAAVVEGRRRAALTAETCPQYLWLDEGWLARPDGHRWICSPPLRQAPAALRGLAREGAFDVLATDHCAFLKADKDAWDGRDIRTVANGLPGLGALAHLAWKVWEDDPDTAALALARRLSAAPAQVAGLSHRKGSLAPGLDADVVVLDPKGPLRPLRSSLSDVFEPYLGFTSTLSFRHVLRRGTALVEHDILCPIDPPGGLLLQAAP